MKRQESTELPRFAVGALAIAGASAANGAQVVQITFTGSYISRPGGNHIVSDYGGDGVADVWGVVVNNGIRLNDALGEPVAFALGYTRSMGPYINRYASVKLRGMAGLGDRVGIRIFITRARGEPISVSQDPS